MVEPVELRKRYGIFMFAIGHALLYLCIEDREDNALVVHISVFEGKWCFRDDWVPMEVEIMFRPIQVEAISHEERLSDELSIANHMLST